MIADIFMYLIVPYSMGFIGGWIVRGRKRKTRADRKRMKSRK